ncbi:MAG: VWA domain-containing protein [Desulfovibrio sp.]|nr:VWA domain-containing protein [Desulfovibrio sp.]
MSEHMSASIPLYGIRAELSATPGLIEGVLEQTYVNVEQVPVEAVYTFPLSVGAVLLDVSCQLGERTLTAKVNAKAKAEARYEEAMAEGRSAMLLKETAPGLYTVSVGQLHPHAVAVLRYRYAQLPVWNGRSLRLRLPTVVAERYGDPADAGFAPWETPLSSIHAEYGFALRLELSGGLEACELSSPTHADKTLVEEDAGRKTVRIEGAVADRDCVVCLERPEVAPAPAPLEIAGEADGEGVICLASVHVPESAQEDPLNLEVVVDCSGSMSGDSIFQAKKGLLCLLEELRPRDRFNLTCFGSSHRSMAEQTIPADPGGIGQAMAFVQGIEADMGGTELASALEAVARRSQASRHGESDRTDILLLTDGEVWDARDWGRKLAKAGCRVFALGVGSAVAADVLERLAKATQGAVELATPNESMNQAVLRLFRRLRRFPEMRDVAWPGSPEWIYPDAPVPCFGGDTLFFFARYAGKAEGRASLKGGPAASASLPEPAQGKGGEALSVLARLGASRLLSGLDDAALGEELALRYRLVSPWTSAVMVDETEGAARPGQLPELRQVPQMSAAGQFGFGSAVIHSCMAASLGAGMRGAGRGARKICARDSLVADSLVTDTCAMEDAADEGVPVQAPSRHVAESQRQLSDVGTSRPRGKGVLASLAEKLLPGRRGDAGGRKRSGREAGAAPQASARDAFQSQVPRLARLRKALAVCEGLPAGRRLPLLTFRGLVQAGLPSRWLELLERIVAQGFDERTVACVFLRLFAHEAEAKLPDELQEAFKACPADAVKAIEEALASGAASL